MPQTPFDAHFNPDKPLYIECSPYGFQGLRFAPWWVLRFHRPEGARRWSVVGPTTPLDLL